jgi:hypothetical protein
MAGPLDGRIVNVTGFDVAPPGFTTATLAVPGEAVRLAGTEAVNCVALTNTVESAEPFHCAVDPGTNPEPLTVRVNAGPPAIAELGLKLLTVGVGTLIVIARACGAEMLPTLSLTVTLKLNGLPTAVEGVPLIAPLEAFSDKPGGNEPALTVQLL